MHGEGKVIEKVLNDLEENLRPQSIFVYGSRARNDAFATSDFELGLLFQRDRLASNERIRSVVGCANVSAYAFAEEDFNSGNIDTPFNKNIFLLELSKYGRTVRGEEFVENFQAPDVRVLDLYSEAQFNLGYALAAVIAHREGSVSAASTLFYKSCLFGTRALIAAKSGMFLASYPEIFEHSKKMNLGVYNSTLESAYDCRLTGNLSYGALFDNISYLNQVVLPFIDEDVTEKGGDTTIQLR